MAKPKQALLDLQKKYGVKPERDEKEEEQASRPASPFQQTQVKSSPKSALDDLKKKYAENPKAWNETKETTPELRDPTFKDLTINSLKQGYYNSIYGQESYKDMTGAANSKDYYEQLLAGDDYQFEADNWWEKAISGAANLLGQQARQWSDPRSIAAGATFATGAAAMGQAGPQVLVPEEIVTVPSAFIAGMTAGSTASNFEIEAGLAYNEMIESGISESTAKKIALGVGGVNAGLEMAQLDELVKAFKVLDKSGAHKKVTKRLVDELKDRGIDIAKETAQEVMQEGSTITGTQIGSKLDTGDWAYDTKEVLGRLGDTAMSSALSFGVMNAPAGVINSANIVRTNKELGNVGGEYQVAAQEVISEGLSMPENTEAYQTAKALKAKMDAGQTITDAELGKAVVDNERAIQVSRANTATESAQETLENLARETVTQNENAQQAQPVQRESTPYNVMAEDNPVRQQRIAEVKNLERKLGYGEEGMKAFNSILESGNQSIEQVRTNFQSAYEAGMTNLPREKANLIDSTQETAYNAGRMDAIKSMQKAEVKGATVWGKEGGLIQNEYSSKLDATTADTLQMIGKATGTKIIMKAQVFGGLANGSYKDGVVTIAADARNPYIVVAKHEVTHRMQDLAPKQYTAYRDYAVQIMAGSGSKTTLVEQYQARAARDNVYLTAELAMDEIAADFTERILTDEKALNDFVNHASKNNDTRTMGQKFFQAVREFINKVKRIFKGDRKKMDQAAREQYGTTIEQLEKAEALWKEAYRAAEEKAQSAEAAESVTQDGVVQNSLKSIDYVNQAKNRTDAMVRLYETDGVRYSMKELPAEEAPKKTKTAYKLFRVDPNRPGEIFPLFVGAEDSIPIGKWIAAEDNESVATLGHWTGTGAKKRFVEDKVRRVKSKIGESWLLDPSQFKEWEQGKTYAVGSRVQYNGHVYVVTKKSNFVSNVAPDMKGSGWKQSDTMTTMAYRPGWHSGDAPYLEHIGKRPNGATKVTHYAANHIWAEVEVPDDIDYQPQANERGMDANGKIREKFADLDYIPTGGNYEYKTNSNMLGKWVISGAIRVTRILSDAETRQMLSTQFADRGLTQRRRMNDSFEEVGDIDLAKYGFEEGKQYSLKTARDTDPAYAPVFYSQMAKVIEGSKQEKMGAASVVPMLKGKGVKAEEIKWSGIEDWLKGKKSVTKQEVLEFIQANDLVIEEQEQDNATLANGGLKMSEADEKTLEDIKGKIDEVYGRFQDQWKSTYGNDSPASGSLLMSGVYTYTNAERYKQLRAETDPLMAKARRALYDHGHLGGDEEYVNEMLSSVIRLELDEEKALKFLEVMDRTGGRLFNELTVEERGSIVEYLRKERADQLALAETSDEERALADLWQPAREYARERDGIYNRYFEEESNRQSRWEQYTVGGGENYRELLFKMPGAKYRNNAMMSHWEQPGVLAHARIQDFNTSGGKMLFVEEIQSDWHNDGQKFGYEMTQTEEEQTRSDLLRKKQDLYAELDKVISAMDQELEDMDIAESAGDPVDRTKYTELVKQHGDLRAKVIKVEEFLNRLENYKHKRAPAAPYAGNYHEFVLKRLLRMAAEDGYSQFGWTTADIQSKRWSHKYAEGYRIEYDQDIPKFLNKYGKKWGAKVGSTKLPGGETVWSMDITDAMRESVLYEGQPQFSLKDSQGNALTKEQAEYFKDSKVRDKDGNLLKLYHGTQAFGFTTLDLGKSDDGISFFMTDSPAVATSYSGTNRMRSVVKEDDKDGQWRIDPYTASVEELVEEYNSVSLSDQVRLLSTKEDIQNWADQQMGWARREIERTAKMLRDLYDNVFSHSAQDEKTTAYLEEAKEAFRLFLDAYQIAESAKTSSELFKARVALLKAQETERSKKVDQGNYFYSMFRHSMRDMEVSQDIYRAFRAVSAAERGEKLLVSGDNSIIDEDTLREDLEWEYRTADEGEHGNYELYANLTNPLVIEARYASWDNITIPGTIDRYEFEKIAGNKRFNEAKTRDFAKYAKAKNYDGVIFKDLYDTGFEGRGNEGASTVVIAFDSNKVKDAYNQKPTTDPDLRYSLKAGDEGATYEENGKKYSLKSLRHDITEGKMFDDLVSAEVFTTEEAGLLKENLEKLISYMLPNASILDMNEAYTKDNRPFSSYKPNSDPLYKISLDFSTLCRKRLMTQYVIEQLQLRENRPMSAEEQIAIRSMLLDYRQQEKALQVACAMCYVEAARLKAPKQMEKFFNETESIMRKHFAKKDKTFNDKVRAAQAQFKVDRGYAADATKKEMSGKDTKALNDMSAKMRKGYTPNAEQQAIIDKAVSLPRSTFLTAANLTALSIDHPEIYDAYTSHIRASTRSKSLEGDVPYYYGDSVGPVSDSFIEGVNAENGMRFDSWSDFQMKHMLDMITAVIDLSVRKSKMHGYTKFPEMVRIFGKTGMMFNLSGVTEGNGFDANGNLVFSDTESIDINEAIKLRKMFPETAGMQCIGVSDDHIRALLRADFIDYVIPYHTSGMNATLRKMAGIYEWDDYTQTQHATKNPKAKKPANADDKWQVEPVWSEFYVAEGKDGYDIMQKTAQRYIDMCHERGLIPKFNDFTNEDGYWKLLVDRKMINQETGQIIEQQPVKPIFDFDLIEREIDNEVDHYDPALEEKALKYVVDNFDAVNQRIKDLKKGHPKKSMLTMGNEILQAYARGTNDTTQHSLKGQDDLLKQNAKLKEVNQELRNQFKTTKFAKVDKKSLDRFTKQLLKDYSSGADINSTREALDDLYTYMANGEDGGVPSWDEAYMRAYNAATDILSNASMMDDEMFQAYKSLRDDLKTTGISIDKRYDHDLIGYESINEFRKANFGRIKLTNDGTPVDVLYEELAYRYPEFFDSDAHMNQADQLSHIEEVLNSLQPTEVNPYSHNMREAATWLANDIMERFFELPQAKPTFADKAERKLAKQKAKDAEKLQRLRAQKNERIASLIVENRARLAVAVSDERMAADSAIKKLKDKYAEKEAKASENKKASILRTKIIRHAQEMSQTLLRPSDKHHIPQALRAPVAELLDSINLESQYTIDPATGKRQKNVPGDPTKRTLAFTRLRKAYQDIIQEDGADIVVDPAIEAMLDRVIEMRDVKLADMTVSQLADVWQVVRVMEHTINTAGKLLSYSKYERTMEWADAMVEDTETRRSKRGTKAEAIRIDMENPYTFFSHYGDAGKDVFRMLRDAQDKQQLMVNNVQEKVQAIVDPKTVRKLEKEVHEFKTERGEKLVLTKAQIMDIYLLTKREQAQAHLLQGGIVQPEVEAKKIKRGTDSILLTINDLSAITGKMSVKEREIAIKLQALTSSALADYGNKASLQAYGYKKFTGNDYWPIKSAREGVHSNVEKGGNNTRSIKNIGLAKTVMPHANNPLDVVGIFKTFSSHAADMIDYAAWLCPMEDANRLFNFQFRDEGGNRTGKTIKGLLDRVGGKGAQQYWHNLMEDIQNGIKTQADNTMIQPINKVIGNVRGASVGANIRVIIQQPTAIFRAAAVLSPEAMFRGMVGGGGWKTALKHSPVAMRKDMGGFDISSPMQMNEILFDSKTGLQRFNEAMMAGAGKADAVTWGRIWNACEAEVKWNRDDLQYRSDEFYKAVNELFTEVIDQSQVVDGVLQRSQLMRSNNALLNQATAFMGEPTMTMNMMLRAWDGLRNETDKSKRGKAIKTFGRTALVLLVTNAVNALAQSLIDAARDDEDEEYWKKFYNALYGVTGEEETLWEKATGAVLSGNLGSGMNPVGYIPFAKDLLSILQGYNVTRADADIAGDIIDATKAFIDSAFGDGKKTIGRATFDLTKQVSKVFGVSALNLERDIWGIVRTIALETGNIPLQYEMEKAIYKIANEKNVSHFADILYKAYQTDKDVYQHIYDDMEASGFNMDKLQSQMESRMKKDQGVNKVSELEQRYLHPDQQSEYDSKMKDIQGSTLWKNANEKQKDDLEATLYDLVTGNTEGLELKAEIAAGKSYGLDETEYLLYELALDMADTPNANGKLGGTPTAAEKAAAIASMDLGNGEIAYLWDTDQALEAFAYGIDMEKYAQFKGAVGNFSGDTKQKQIDQYLRQMGVSTKEYLYLMGTVYSSYKKRKDYISYFGKQD